MASRPESFLAAAKAEDVADLLSHIAWTDVIRPALMKHRETLTKHLVAAVLGPETKVSKEQIGGMIYGLDYVEDLLRQILTRGEVAVKDLRVQGITLNLPTERKL